MGAEALVIVGLIVPATRPAAAMLAFALLAIYGVAIAINLVRGNRRIDCGCGGAGQGLSWFLVGRKCADRPGDRGGRYATAGRLGRPRLDQRHLWYRFLHAVDRRGGATQ